MTGPNLLITNDDGVAADGLRALVGAIGALGRVWVCAPDSQRSGIGHGLTLYEPLHVHAEELPGTQGTLVVSGTPADAVKFALTKGFEDVPFDLVASGINHGPNTGTNVLYSGTVAAALEALICGVPGLAVSLDVTESPDFSFAASEAARVVREILAQPLPPGIALNLNIPNRSGDSVAGVKITRMGLSGFREVYNHTGRAPDGRDRFLIDGDFIIREETLEYDAVALREGYVSITPLQLDMTARGDLGSAATWKHLTRPPAPA